MFPLRYIGTFSCTYEVAGGKTYINNSLLLFLQGRTSKNLVQQKTPENGVKSGVLEKCCPYKIVPSAAKSSFKSAIGSPLTAKYAAVKGVPFVFAG